MLSNMSMFSHVVSRTIASGLGSGYAPFLSGTVGSAALVVVWLASFNLGLFSSPISFTLTLISLTLLGLLTARSCVAKERLTQNGGAQKIDPGYIVIDEWVGMLIALYGVLPGETLKILGAFALFRIFDILKPGPIRRLEKLPYEWGIMADDIAAGLVALLVRLLCGF